MLGTNGGGFFNANSAHPFENPTPFSNLLQMLSIFIIPAGLTYTLGRMTGSPGHGWRCLPPCSYFSPADSPPILLGRIAASPADPRRRPNGSVTAPAGIWKARKFATASPNRRFSPPSPRRQLRGRQHHARLAHSAGRHGGAHQHHARRGDLRRRGFRPLRHPHLRGASGLHRRPSMVGRTPEYLGKKIEAYDVKMTMLYRAHLPAHQSSPSPHSSFYRQPSACREPQQPGSTRTHRNVSTPSPPEAEIMALPLPA